ncbi:MAG: ATP-binding cassette domain-containing protein [Candidatus Zixiibacteriota bacterium]
MSFELGTGHSLAVVGPNGSGKSTLLMTILALYRPTKGQVEFFENDGRLDMMQLRSYVAFVSPYLNLYDQLTAEENLKFFSTVSGGNVTGKQINRLLKKVGLEGRGNDPVAEYSSGMKQRLKYAVALLKDPAFLLLDEPTSNLDEDGKQLVVDIIRKYKSRCITIIATNDEKESRLAEKQLRLGE